MEKITGRLTGKEGFVTGTQMQKTVKLEIEGVGYNYFLNNNPDRKNIIRGIAIGDLIEYEVKENNGFKFIDEVRKVEIETKENPEPIATFPAVTNEPLDITTDSSPNPYPNQNPPPKVETEDMKWNRINAEKREAILKGQCLNIASTKKETSKDIVDFAMKLLEEIRRQKYQEF